MFKKNRPEAGKRSEILRQKRSEERSAWLHEVNGRADHIPATPKADSQTTSGSAFRPLHENSNPLAQIAIDQKEFTAPKLKLSWRYLSASVAILAIFLLVSAWRSIDYQVTDIQIDGIQRVSKEEVYAVLDIQQERSYLLSPYAIETAIEKNFPELHEIQVNIALPARVNIKLTERQPHIGWQYEGKKIWIDEEGYLLPGRGNVSTLLTITAGEHPPFHTPEDRIVLQGEKRIRKTMIMKGAEDSLALFEVYERIDPITYQAIKDLNLLLPEQDVILYDSRRGLGWNDLRGWQVYVGSDLREIKAKMNMVEEIVKTLTKAKIQPTVISVEEINAPYYRLD